MSDKQLPAVDRRVEKAIEMRARGRSWRECGQTLGCSGSAIRRAVIRRCPEAAGREFKREALTLAVAGLYEQHVSQTLAALNAGQIRGFQAARLYLRLAQRQEKLENWDRPPTARPSSLDVLAQTLGVHE